MPKIEGINNQNQEDITEIEEANEVKNWKDISSKFTEELQKQWEEKGFSYWEAKEWIEIGMKPNDAGFCAWLRDEVEWDALETVNNINTEHGFQEEDLREQYQEYLTGQLELAQKKWDDEVPAENWKTREELADRIKKLEDKLNANEEKKKDTQDTKKKIRTSVQDWLDKEYPKKKRKSIKKLDFSKLDLKGELELSDFVNLEELDISNEWKFGSDSPKLKITDIGSKKIIVKWKYSTEKWINAQEWLEENYPLITRDKIKKLEIASYNFKKENSPNDKEYLFGSLKLKGFANLKELNCWGQKLTNIDLNDCSKLISINCANNELTNLNLSNNWELVKLECKENRLNTLGLANNPKLKELDCSNNKLRTLDLANNSQLKNVSCSSNILTNLVLDDCQNLESLNCSYNRLTNLELKKVKKLSSLHCSNNWLNKLSLGNNKYLTRISCEKNNLVNLDLSKNNRLTKINCSDNQLTRIVISNHVPQLEEFYCSNNLLTDFNFSALKAESMKKISVANNNFPKQDLGCFSKFINLSLLSIGNNKREIRENIFNRFYGSLEPLKKMENLKFLNVGSTDINEGLECLPDSIKYFVCSTGKRPESKVKKIEEELRKFGEPAKKNNFTHLLKNWKVAKEEEALTQYLETNLDHNNPYSWLLAEEKSTLKKVKNKKRKGNSKRETTNLLDESDNEHEYCSAQGWLDEEYPEQKRSSIIELNISRLVPGHIIYDEKIAKKTIKKGSLKLTGFFNLEVLECGGNALTELDLSDCYNLRVLQCSYNCLINKDFLKQLPCPEKLTHLAIGQNKFELDDLTFIKNFKNLNYLDLTRDTSLSLNFLRDASVEKLRRSYYTEEENSVYYYSSDSSEETSDVEENSDVVTIGEKDEENKINLSWLLETYFSWEEEKEWGEWGFDYQEAKKWNESAGYREYSFAYWLKKKDHKPEENLSYEKIKECEEYEEWINNAAQELFNAKYSLEKRKEVTGIKISRGYEKKLGGKLVIENFPRLKTFTWPENQITSLTLNNLPKLTHLDVYGCPINNLIINNCPKIEFISVERTLLTNLSFLDNLEPSKLTVLAISNTPLPPQDLTVFSKFINLEEFVLVNTKFYGSLKPLKNLTKLKKLNFAGSGIDSGLEYLPENFYMLGYGARNNYFSEEPKEKEFLEELKDCYDEIEEDGFASLYSWFNLHAWRWKKPFYKQLKEALNKLGYSQLNELMSSIFFNVRTGEFGGDIQGLISVLKIDNLIFVEKEKEINNLELRVKELTDLIKQQKEKIVNAYLCFASENEREQLKKLVTVYLEYTNYKKRETNAPDYGKRCRRYERECLDIKDEICDELGEEVVNSAQRILTDCEKLADWEIELENKLNSKQLLLKEQKQIPNLIANYGDNYQKLEKKHITYHNPIIQELASIEQNIVEPILKYLIGKGGYGEVYYGEWKLQEVAVKKLYLFPHNTSESDLKDIKKEIEIFKNLKNKYIIQYYDLYSNNQEFLIIMDYAENGTLTKFIKDNKDKEHDWKFNNELIRQITLGLTYIHQSGVIHRDLKSMNILLDKHFQVKISDFGLSKVKNISSSQTKDIKGTLEWMAPELLKGERYSEQSDIYSLGMVIWEIAAKCTAPFKDVDNVLVHVVINNGREKIPNSTPKNVREIIEGCWKINPSERISLVNIIKSVENGELSTQISYNNSLSDFKSIQIQSSKLNEQICTKNLDSKINDFNLDELNVKEGQSETFLQTEIQIPSKK